jgi:hypothetical protein
MQHLNLHRFEIRKDVLFVRVNKGAVMGGNKYKLTAARPRSYLKYWRRLATAEVRGPIGD